MGNRKWNPTQPEQVVETGRYRYVLGVYDHAEYGQGCLRVSKFIRENGYFIGHFVIVPEDRDVVTEAMVDLFSTRLRN